MFLSLDALDFLAGAYPGVIVPMHLPLAATRGFFARTISRLITDYIHRLQCTLR